VGWNLSGFFGGLPSSGEFGILSMAGAANVVAIAADPLRGRKSVQAFLASQPDGKTVQRFRVTPTGKMGNQPQKAQKPFCAFCG